MKIYFDNVLVDTDYYTQFSMSSKLFNENDNFVLGKTLCNSIKIGIDKNYAPSNVQEVVITINDETFLTMVVDNVEENDFEIVYTLTDKMVNLNFNYDASEIFVEGQTTLLDILQDICLKANISLYTTSFVGSDKVITWYDNTITAREYVGYIAELNGGYAVINKNGELELKRFNNTPVKTINFDECSDFIIGEYHKITQVEYDNGLLRYTAGDETNNTLYINPNNVFIENEEDILNIYNIVKNLEFYSFKTNNSPIYSDVYTGDCIKFVDENNNEYLTFAQSEPNFYGDFAGGYKLSVNSEKQEATVEINGTENNYRRLKIVQDRTNAKLELLSEEVIQVSKTTIGQGSIELENAYEGTLHRLEITGQISVDDPQSYTDLYGFPNIISEDNIISNSNIISRDVPYRDGSTGYPKTTILTIDEEEYTLDFDFLNYINPTICDKLIIEDGKQWIERNVAIDNQGNKYHLPYTVIENKQELNIQVKSNSTITLNSFNEANLKAVYLLQNEYTENFSPTIDAIARINLTPGQAQIQANKISLEGKDINLTTDNIEINSTNFSVDKDGKVTATAGDIAGFKMDGTDGFEYNIYAPYNYNYDDLIRLSEILNGSTPTAEELIKYDLDGSGTITIIDYTRISYYVENNITSVNPGKFVIAIPKQNRLISAKTGFIDGNGVLISGFGFRDATFKTLTLTDSENNTTVFSDGETGNITCVSLTQTSKEENKKNFELYQNALKEIKGTDIYKYNLKNENDTEKKHIGFVIGKKRKYSHDITSSNNGEEVGVDTYSMVSVLWQGVKEQQETIERLEKRIEELERK